MNEVHALVSQRHASLIERARAAQSAGRKVVGYVGLDVPEELILAAGLVPLRLTADLDAPTGAAQRFGDGGHPLLRSLVSRLLDAPYGFIDHLVVGSTPRNLTALPILINQLHDSDPAFARFRVHQFDLLHSDSDSARRFNLASVTQLAAVLVEWSGQPLHDDALRQSIDLCNATRRLLGEYQRQRSDGLHGDGATALRLHGCATGADRTAFNALLRDWLRADALRGTSADAAIPRLLYSGSGTDTTALYECVEARGLCIIDDDQEFGARAVGPLIDTDEAPLVALATGYAHRAPAAAGWSLGARTTYLAQRITAARPDGVLFYSAAYDHPPAWEFPALRDVAKAAGPRTATLDAASYRQLELVSRCAGDFAQALHTQVEARRA